MDESLQSVDRKRSPGGLIRVLYAGAIIPAKGVHHLIESIALLSKKDQERVELWIAGRNTSSDIESYYSKCRAIEADISASVTWLGWRDDIQSLIISSDIICLPSYSEGMPRIVQESMYYKKVVLATPVGGVRDLIKDGVTGYLVGVGSPSDIAKVIQGLLNKGIDPRI